MRTGSTFRVYFDKGHVDFINTACYATLSHYFNTMRMWKKETVPKNIDNMKRRAEVSIRGYKTSDDFVLDPDNKAHTVEVRLTDMHQVSYRQQNLILDNVKETFDLYDKSRGVIESYDLYHMTVTVDLSYPNHILFLVFNVLREFGEKCNRGKRIYNYLYKIPVERRLLFMMLGQFLDYNEVKGYSLNPVQNAHGLTTLKAQARTVENFKYLLDKTKVLTEPHDKPTYLTEGTTSGCDNYWSKLLPTRGTIVDLNDLQKSTNGEQFACRFNKICRELMPDEVPNP